MEIDEWHPKSGPERLESGSFPASGVNSLAPLSLRATARLIDLVVLMIPYFAVLTVVFALAGPQALDPESVTAASWLAMTGPFVGLTVLYDGLGVMLWGQTLGKLVVGVRVARLHNGRCPLWWESCVRAGLLGVAALLPPPFGIIGASVLVASAMYDPMRRNVLDHAGGTVVVRSR